MDFSLHKKMVIFSNTELGFKIGVILNDKLEIDTFEVWDEHLVSGCDTYMNDYPLPPENKNIRQLTNLYSNTINEFEFTTKLRNNIITCTFHGTLFNSNNESIIIENGELTLDLNQFNFDDSN